MLLICWVVLNLVRFCLLNIAPRIIDWCYKPLDILATTDSSWCCHVTVELSSNGNCPYMFNLLVKSWYAQLLLIALVSHMLDSCLSSSVPL